MPRIRSIKPELPDDRTLATVSRDARYTFILLITQADDEGLVAGAHRQLLGALYPHEEDVTVPMLLAWIEELVAIGVVRWRQTRDGALVLEIVKWAKHQRIDNKGRSRIADKLVPLSEDSPTLAETRGDSPQPAEVRGLEVGSRRLDVGGRRLDEGNRKKEHTAKSPSAVCAFDDVWRKYPSRAGGNPRKPAERAWQARIKAGIPPDRLLAGVERYRVYCEHEGQIGTRYVMQAARFFGTDGHFDEPWTVSENGGGGDDTAARVSKLLEEQEAADRRSAELLARRAAGVGV